MSTRTQALRRAARRLRSLAGTVKRGGRAPGHVDIVDHGRVTGWAMSDRRSGRYEQLEIVVDGVSVAKILASRYRPELKSAGIGEGDHAFDHRFDEAVGVFHEARVEVRLLGSGVVLPGARAVGPVLMSGGTFQAELDVPFISLTPHPPKVTGRDVTLAARLLAESSDVEIVALRGRLAGDPSITPEAAPDALWANVAVRPYRVAVPLEVEEGADLAEVELRPRWTLTPSAESSSLLPLRITAPLDSDWHTLPEPENWVRTSGPRTQRDWFVQNGYSVAQKIDLIIGRHLEAPGPLRILDWGSGCGRVTVPLARLLRPDDTVVGVDVDDFNVEWCQRNIPEIEWAVGDLYPPLGLPDDSLDVIFGISVMTHLAQAAQIVWLRELRRVLKPGGICILTTHGEHALIPRHLDSRLVSDLIDYGISDSGRDPIIALDEPGYYRGTFQLRQQVLAAWSGVMPVVAHYPTANAGQDIFVLRNEPR